jgi:hypothetical protein
MGRNRESGRFVRATEEELAARRMELESADEAPVKARKRKDALSVARVRYCRKLTSQKVAEGTPDLVDALLPRVKEGSMEHIQAFLKLLSIEQGKVVPERPKRRGKSIPALLLEQFRKPPLP